MSVRVAASAGFCFGVDRAVGLVEQTVREGKRAVTLGPIIHNLRHCAFKLTVDSARFSSIFLCEASIAGKLIHNRNLVSLFIDRVQILIIRKTCQCFLVYPAAQTNPAVSFCRHLPLFNFRQNILTTVIAYFAIQRAVVLTCIPIIIYSIHGIQSKNRIKNKQKQKNKHCSFSQ